MSGRPVRVICGEVANENLLFLVIEFSSEEAERTPRKPSRSKIVSFFFGLFLKVFGKCSSPAPGWRKKTECLIAAVFPCIPSTRFTCSMSFVLVSGIPWNQVESVCAVIQFPLWGNRKDEGIKLATNKDLTFLPKKCAFSPEIETFACV